MKKSLKQQSESYLKKFIAFNEPRVKMKRGDNSSSGIHSVNSFHDTCSSLAYSAKQIGVERLKHISKEKALIYLLHRYHAGLTGKSISRDNRALARLLGERLPTRSELYVLNKEVHLTDKWLKQGVREKCQDRRFGQMLAKLWDKQKEQRRIPIKDSSHKVTSTRPGYSRNLKDISRAYTDNQIKAILSEVKDEQTKLAIIICRDAGLRVSETIEIRKVGEGRAVTDQRDWRNDLHKYRSNAERYVVTGKGGLVRTVSLTSSVAQKLESYRLKESRLVSDRKVNYEQRYSLTFGNNLSHKFTRASVKALGYSLGAHGLRHSYAQARMTSLINMGESLKSAKHIVSQEMGHMRMKITDVYLR